MSTRSHIRGNNGSKIGTTGKDLGRRNLDRPVKVWASEILGERQKERGQISLPYGSAIFYFEVDDEAEGQRFARLVELRSLSKCVKQRGGE